MNGKYNSEYIVLTIKQGEVGWQLNNLKLHSS